MAPEVGSLMVPPITLCSPRALGNCTVGAAALGIGGGAAWISADGAAGTSAGGAPRAITPPHSMQKRGLVGGSAAPQWRQKRGGRADGWDVVIARSGSFGE